CALLPFEFDRSGWTLTRVIDRAQSKPLTVKIVSRAGVLELETSRTVGNKSAANIARDVRHMFRLDEELTAFYREMSGDAEFSWIAEQGAGRLLRSPTIFEDLVKMICTTNCSWALTVKMVEGLVRELGEPSDDLRKSFPSAAAMAGKSVSFFRDRIRAGYRAPYLKELAQRVASGALDVESWLATDTPLTELIK